jgi:hypothetical protein
MDHLTLDKIEHQHVLEEKGATHVVTQIQYGADAFFVFDREKKVKRDKSDFDGSIKGDLSKLNIPVSGEAKAKYNAKDEDTSETYQCTYYGDFHGLPRLPKDIKEAEELVQELVKVS